METREITIRVDAEAARAHAAASPEDRSIARSAPGRGYRPVRTSRADYAGDQCEGAGLWPDGEETRRTAP